MSTIGQRLEQLERIGDWITRPLRWLVLLMVIATVVVVLLRYAFDTGAIFLTKSVMYLHGLFFMLALGFGVAEDSRGSIFFVRLPVRRQRLVNLIKCWVFLLPVAVSLRACPTSVLVGEFSKAHLESVAFLGYFF